MTTNSIIRIIKTSNIETKVKHRKVILPQFSAPGVDKKLLKEKTGFSSVFGPAYAKDIPFFIKNGNKTKKQTLSNFNFKFRLEMLLSMNFLVWAIIAFILFFIDLKSMFCFTSVYWISGLILYLGFPLLPGKSGIFKAFCLSIFEIIGIMVVSSYILNVNYLTYWGNYWLLAFAVFIMTMWFGFDLRGIIGGYKSEAEHIFYMLGIKSFGRFFSASVKSLGVVTQDTNKCINCCSCINVCPQGVFEFLSSKKVIIKKQDKCFACNACVMQCKNNALSIH